MATRTITTRLAIDGEQEYKSALKNIGAQLSLHKSELAKVEAQYRESANSLTALEARETALKGILGDLSARHSEHAAMLEKARQAQQRYAADVEQTKAKLDALKSTAGASADQQEALAKELSEAERKLQEAANSVTYYQKQLNHTEKDQANFTSDLKKTKGYMDEARSSADHCAASLDQYGREVKTAREESKDTGEAVGALAAALAAGGLKIAFEKVTESIRECVDASVAFESAMTGVYKTVDGTDAQLAAISDGIKQMSTEIPATTAEIAAVAESAGQLGIATGDVLAFTRVMLDLGESTNLSADEAATALARFANITGTSAADYERLGSVIVGLGNHFATTEAEITETATRLASAGTLAGLTEPEIMALATAMSSVGIEAEAGGTAMTQTLTAMEQAVAKGGADLEAFARIAGMSASAFKTAWKTDAVTAIQAFIAGLGRLDEQGESVTLALDELGLSGVRQGNMLKSLALAADTLTGAVDLANRAWAENTALADEANKRYETTESKLAMMRNAFENVQAAAGDALAPALREVAEAGTEAFSTAAEFLEKNPDVVRALVAVTAGLGAFAGTVGVTVTYLKVIKPLWATFNAAVSATPVGMVTVALGALMTAFAAYLAMLPKADDQVRELTDSLKDSQKAFEEVRGSVREESADVLASVSALETLAAAEVKSTAQKRAMAELVEQLNESVPELNLAYDAQTDSLTDLATGADASAASIREIAQAQAEQQLREAEVQRLTELYVEQARIADDLAAAQYRLGEAEGDLAAMQEAGTYGAMGYEMATQQVDAAVAAAGKSVRELTGAMEENVAAGRELDPAYGTLEGGAARMGAVSEELTRQTGQLTAAQNTLTAALEEQEAQGGLSEATARALIAAGYESVLVTDAETGAVRLNRDAYLDAARSKIDEQIATLEARRASAEAKAALLEEAGAANDAAIAHYNKAKALRAEKHASRGELEGAAARVDAYDAQIAALRQAKEDLGRYTDASETAARTSASTSGKIRTQAERDLAKFKEVKAQLDHQKALDQIAERDYYAKLREYRDAYLTDDGNLEEYRRVTEQLYQYDKALADREAALWEEQTKTLVGELESRTKAVLDAQRQMEEKLAGYGDLFKVEEDRMSLESIQEQTKAIQAYGNTLQQLKDKGVDGGLLQEIVGLGVDEGTQYGQKLLGMAPEELEEYVGLWEEKQAEAKRIAEAFYRDQLDALETEYNDKLGQALGELTGTAFTSGQDTVQGLIDGLADRESALYGKARAMAEEVSRILSEAYAASGKADGSHAAGLPYVPYDGYLAELHRGERVLTAEEARAYIARSVPNSYDPPAPRPQPDVGAMLSQAVNAVGTNAWSGGTYRVEVPLHLNGREVGRAILEDLRAVARADPEVRND